MQKMGTLRERLGEFDRLMAMGDEGRDIICEGVPRLEELPRGWRYIKGAITAPTGWRWAYNGRSRFAPGYRQALIREGE